MQQLLFFIEMDQHFKIGILDYPTSNLVPFLFGPMCFYINNLVFNYNRETNNFVLVLYVLLSVEELFSFLVLLVQATCTVFFST